MSAARWLPTVRVLAVFAAAICLAGDVDQARGQGVFPNYPSFPGGELGNPTIGLISYDNVSPYFGVGGPRNSIFSISAGQFGALDGSSLQGVSAFLSLTEDAAWTLAEVEARDPLLTWTEPGVFHSATLPRGAVNWQHTAMSLTQVSPFALRASAHSALLYGSTSDGGEFEMGSIYAMDVNRGLWARVHSFGPAGGTHPMGGLLSFGNAIYGTTRDGGAAGAGTIFRISHGVGADFNFQTLHDFAGADGANPVTRLSFGSATGLIGTTPAGGASNLGTIFRMNFDGTGFETMHEFAGADGAQPLGSLIAAGGGLFGTTYAGGDFNLGTVFSVHSDGTLHTLHSFNGANGANPQGGMARTQFGDAFYAGTTRNGGDFGAGTVFYIVFPEPSSLCLVGIAGGGLAAGCLRTRRRRAFGRRA